MSDNAAFNTKRRIGNSVGSIDAEPNRRFPSKVIEGYKNSSGKSVSEKDETMLSVFISSDTRRTLDLLKLALGKSFKEIVSDAVADYADANKDKIKSYINII